VPAGSFQLDAGLLVDQLSMSFVLLITFVGSLIHVYSLGYMEHDPDKRRFFAYLNLFVAAMLLLVLADSYLLVFVGWEGVGLGVLPAHRLLEPQPGIRDGRQQGLLRQPGR
jgi:NADH-quinone oxidoreductase subunit L